MGRDKTNFYYFTTKHSAYPFKIYAKTEKIAKSKFDTFFKTKPINWRTKSGMLKVIIKALNNTSPTDERLNYDKPFNLMHKDDLRGIVCGVDYNKLHIWEQNIVDLIVKDGELKIEIHKNGFGELSEYYKLTNRYERAHVKWKYKKSLSK